MCFTEILLEDVECRVASVTFTFKEEAGRVATCSHSCRGYSCLFALPLGICVEICD